MEAAKTLKPWREIAQPHADIADGSFDESLFAADLGLVDRGRGPVDYLDGPTFCSKTHLTANLRNALVEIARRLEGDPSAAGVFRLQTEFGGGKTHTLLAAYHLFRDPESVARTDLARDLVAAAGVASLPRAKVVVLDGSSIMAGEPEETPEGLQIHTLLGQLAYRLGGTDAYEIVRSQDEQYLGSSTHQLANLLERHTPCLILLDEALEYLNKGLAVQTHDGNLAATTLTIVKELCTAVANVPGAAILATLTSSRLEDYATLAGQEMQERLSKVVGRTENIVTPVEGDDIFPILHRRLFAEVGSHDQRIAIANLYGDYYESLGDVVGNTYRDASYRDRLAEAYPFHPELVDILTNRWGSLSGFQRTRGALRTLAHTVKALWQRNDGAPLIHPGDVPLEDAGIRAEILRFAGDSYKAALNADIIREDSKAPEEDRRRGGDAERHRLATGLATTAFLNSFGAEKVVGASTQQMLIGVGRPELSRGLIEDVRDALANALWYMRYEGGRYRFTTEPNLNKVIVEREGAITDDRVQELIWESIGKVVPASGDLRIVLRVSEAADLPDEPRLTLGILGFETRLNDEYEPDALKKATQVLTQRGSTDRANKNAALLVAADAPALLKARATARTVAAMQDLKKDRHRLGRFNAEQKEQLDERLSGAQERLPQQVAMCYRHLLLLSNGGASARLEHIDLGPAKADATISGRVLDYLRNTDRLLETTLAPAALLSPRFGVLPEGEDAVELDRLITYFYRLPNLPKLANADVLRSCLVEGVSKKVFGLASGAGWNAEDAVLRFGVKVDPTEVQFQPGTFLVRATAMSALQTARKVEAQEEDDVGPTEQESGPSDESVSAGPEPAATTFIRELAITVPNVPVDKAREVLKTAVLPLAAESSDVTVTFSIRARAGADGFSRNTVDLVVKEGLHQLGLKDVKVEEGP